MFTKIASSGVWAAVSSHQLAESTFEIRPLGDMIS